jgi:hypothetical protein
MPMSNPIVKFLQKKLTQSKQSWIDGVENIKRNKNSVHPASSLGVDANGKKIYDWRRGYFGDIHIDGSRRRYDE